MLRLPHACNYFGNKYTFLSMVFNRLGFSIDILNYKYISMGFRHRLDFVILDLHSIKQLYNFLGLRQLKRKFFLFFFVTVLRKAVSPPSPV